MAEADTEGDEQYQCECHGHGGARMAMQGDDKLRIVWGGFTEGIFTALGGFNFGG